MVGASKHPAKQSLRRFEPHIPTLMGKLSWRGMGATTLPHPIPTPLFPKPEVQIPNLRGVCLCLNLMCATRARSCRPTGSPLGWTGSPRLANCWRTARAWAGSLPAGWICPGPTTGKRSTGSSKPPGSSAGSRRSSSWWASAVPIWGPAPCWNCSPLPITT